MKKNVLILILCLIFASVFAESKALVVYFSKTGSTKTIGDWIAKYANADIFEIEPVESYEKSYEEMKILAQKEYDENARPQIKNKIENFDSYDVIFVGNPLWLTKMPMIMHTFYEQYDFSGKKLIPFLTYGGSPFARGWEVLDKLEPNAKIIDKIAIKNSNVKNSEKKIKKFVKSLKLDK